VNVAESWTFEHPDRFTCGSIGEPGRRTFYLQIRNASEIVTLKAEKEQVRVLGQYLAQVAEQLGPVDPDRDVVGLVEPIESLFVVGDVGVATDVDAGEVVVVLEELPEWPLDEEFDDADDLDDVVGFADEDAESTGRSVTITVPIAQAAAFSEVAAELLQSGRPPCRLCGAPINPEGHACPRWN